MTKAEHIAHAKALLHFAEVRFDLAQCGGDDAKINAAYREMVIAARYLAGLEA